MKMSITATAILSALILSSCVKTETKTTKIDLPEIKKYEPVVSKKSGFKCDITGEVENKEVFLEVSKKEDKTSVSFFDFVSATKISVVSAKFEGFTLMSFSVSEASDDSKILSGEGVLLHSNLSSLSDEGKVLSATGKITLNEDMSGVLEQKLLISKDDSSIQNTDFKELGKIENCEAFEAVWL